VKIRRHFLRGLGEFARTNGLAYGLLRRADRRPHRAAGGCREPPVVLALGTALGIISISAATGSCALLTLVAGGSLAWFLGPLLLSTVYRLVSALELVLARGAHLVAGTENIDER
jgi:hypothetical protein